MAEWPAYHDGTKATMVFDRCTKAAEDYDRALMAAMAPHAPSLFSIEARIARMLEQADSDGEGSDWLY